jgi:hypothetical protein
VPGQYALLLPLDVTINDAADSVKFMKKKQTLTAKFTVISGSSANGSSSAGQQQQQRGGDSAQRGAAAVAAEEAARRDQQRRLNTEAAEEWMRWVERAAGCGLY